MLGPHSFTTCPVRLLNTSAPQDKPLLNAERYPNFVSGSTRNPPFETSRRSTLLDVRRGDKGRGDPFLRECYCLALTSFRPMCVHDIPGGII